MVVLILVVIISIFKNEDCMYANRSGTFTYEEMNFKGRDFKTCMRKWEMFKKENNSDTVLYRMCKMNPLKFWNYFDYVSHPGYKLPYLSYDEMIRTRGEITNMSGFQDF